jgi:hypothetical protein
MKKQTKKIYFHQCSQQLTLHIKFDNIKKIIENFTNLNRNKKNIQTKNICFSKLLMYSHKYFFPLVFVDGHYNTDQNNSAFLCFVFLCWWMQFSSSHCVWLFTGVLWGMMGAICLLGKIFIGLLNLKFKRHAMEMDFDFFLHNHQVFIESCHLDNSSSKTQ